MSQDLSQTTNASAPKWQPLSAVDRRVAGVLVEKAKTTPEAYPMTLNAIVTACNQKSNRAPVMQVEPEQVQESLDRLRPLGAVGRVEGYGRVPKYRHYLYEWLGVDKVELAVMGELLLRGDQTEGELRVRASRMESIADLPALRNVLNALHAKGLIISLTPEGRGHAISHALYRPQELERLKQQYSGRAMAAENELPEPAGEPHARTASPAGNVPGPGEIERLRSELSELRAQHETLAASVEQLRGELDRLKQDLGAG